MSLRAVLHAVAEEQLATGKHIRIDDVIDRAYADYPGAFAEESERLIWQAARRITKDVLAGMFDDDEHDAQQPIPGLGLPSVIAVRDDGGEVTYVSTPHATYADLEAGLRERELNVTRAMAKRDRYRLAMKRLRPHMDADEVTVAEALAKERARKAAS